MTPTRALGPRSFFSSSAAYRPAPPAPTTTASSSWTLRPGGGETRSAGSIGLAERSYRWRSGRVEADDHDHAKDQPQHRHGGERYHQQRSEAAPSHEVADDDAR